MINFDIIQDYIMTYAGSKYTKPINDDDPMMQLMIAGKSARKEFIKLGREVSKQLPDFIMCRCTSWINMVQTVPNYLWIQFKKKGFENSPSSITLAAKKVEEKFYLYVAVEINDMEATKEDFNRHNELLNMPLENSELYISGNDEYFNLKQNKKYVKTLIDNNLIAKIRVQKDIKEPLSEIRSEEIITEINESIEILMPYYNKIIDNFSKDGVVVNKQIKEGQQMNKKITNAWIIICNPRFYDVIGAFKKFNCIEWKQSTNIQQGDTVYIYIGNPYKEIRYKCVARKVDLEKTIIDDSEFILDGSNYENYGRYMTVELVREYEEKQYPYSELKKNGLKSVQGPGRISEELANYIKFVEIQELKKSLQEDHTQDNDLLHAINTTLTEESVKNYEYEGCSRPKQPVIMRNGIKAYPRSRSVAMNALAHAHYLCEVDSSHPVFIRRNTNINYTEPHHLVPMAYSNLFDVSLDVEENIVSLCSHCHNQLHYGRDVEEILKKLYDMRISYLKQVGIDISFDQLLEMYVMKYITL